MYKQFGARPLSAIFMVRSHFIETLCSAYEYLYNLFFWGHNNQLKIILNDFKDNLCNATALSRITINYP